MWLVGIAPKMLGGGYDANDGGLGGLDMLVQGAGMVGRDADGLRDTFAAPEPEAQAAEEPAGRPVNPGGETRTPSSHHQVRGGATGPPMSLWTWKS